MDFDINNELKCARYEDDCDITDIIGGWNDAEDTNIFVNVISTVDSDNVNNVNTANKVGAAERYINDRSSVEKDAVITKLISPTISPCAAHLNRAEGEACMSKNMLTQVSGTLGIQGMTSGEILDKSKAKLNCNDERCVLTKLQDKIGRNEVKHEINTTLKLQGPTDTTLLSNVNIDGVMRQFNAGFGKFFPHKFNMRNYANYSWVNGYVVQRPDSLATILFYDLYNRKYNGTRYTTVGCIVNTDVYQGPGKHWMALFVDARGEKEWTVEFFNSSGNSPTIEFVDWLVKTKNSMTQVCEENNISRDIKIVKVADIRHQQSKTECGLYSLFYIWARLHKIPPEYFLKNPIPDQLMFEFRHHLFEDPNKKHVKKFDWDSYKNTTHIEWE